jgi:hypothetical protein
MNVNTFLARGIILLALCLAPSASAVSTNVGNENISASSCTSAVLASLPALELTLCTSKTLYRIGDTVVQTTLLTNTSPEALTFALDLRNEVFLRTDHHCFRFCAVTEEDTVVSLAPGETFNTTVTPTVLEQGPYLIKVSVFACPVGTSCFVSDDAFTNLSLRIIVAQGPP